MRGRSRDIREPETRPQLICTRTRDREVDLFACEKRVPTGPGWAELSVQSIQAGTGPVDTVRSEERHETEPS
jgi:hypothetical protein